VTPTDDRIWSAIMLAHGPATCSSILAGRPVRAGTLDGFFFRRALRGRRLPSAEAYVLVTEAMLDAVHEAGPVPETWPDLSEHLRPPKGAAA
jgi:hypothetical protein